MPLHTCEEIFMGMKKILNRLELDHILDPMI